MEWGGFESITNRDNSIKIPFVFYFMFSALIENVPANTLQGYSF